MKSIELINIGAKELKVNQIKTFKLDAEILLSSMNLRITAASTPIVSATSFEKERLSVFT